MRWRSRTLGQSQCAAGDEAVDKREVQTPAEFTAGLVLRERSVTVTHCRSIALSISLRKECIAADVVLTSIDYC